jgi:iron complex outermembrane receptor protein
VEFDQFPAELLSQVVIYKTPDAGLVGQGLSSTIDLRTVRPLDFSKRAVAVNVRQQKTGIGSGAGEGKGDRVALSYVDQFADRKIGVAVGSLKTTTTALRSRPRAALAPIPSRPWPTERAPWWPCNSARTRTRS